ncbi:hypothetical protein F0L68_11545 [Solihabitans fulvus]|uniref:Uncharacterized protein n=1 Tax=Solihabitans fulvus TaxID=1892852 RepID=A0A5B2XI35_9PSEU|nr:hypothetical protein [Solihabitans fulvus]KAA2262854.1 hypothetical protein F0L68_11545 [Solihabitans fulvus]
MSGNNGPPATANAETNGNDLTVAATPHEYRIALAWWADAATDHLMMALDPLYAQTPREPMESIPAPMTGTSSKNEAAVSSVELEVITNVSVPAMINGDLDDLHAAIAETAQQMIEQTMRQYFAVLADATSQAGNTVDAGDDIVEAYLMVLAKMDIAFDEDGRPDLALYVSPENANRVEAQLAAITPAQSRRFTEILMRKREEFNASRRRRRLPRHGH